MRVFNSPLLKHTTKLALAVCLSLTAMSPSQASDLKTENSQNETPARGLQDQSTKPLNFAEITVFENESSANYRDKYAISCLIYSYYRHLLSVQITVFLLIKLIAAIPSLF